MCVRRRSDELITVPPKGKGMRTATAASVEPAGREEMSGVAHLKPWSGAAQWTQPRWNRPGEKMCPE